MSNGEGKMFVSELQPISQQVGQHIIKALQQPRTAAVITSIVPGFPTDRLVSTPITVEQMAQIRQILQPVIDVASAEDDRQIGFQLPENPEEKE